LKVLSLSQQSAEAAVLRLLIELGAQVVRADEGSLLVFDRAARSLVFAMTAGSRASERTLVGQRVPLGKGVVGLAAETHEVQIGAPTFRNVRQTPKRGKDPAWVIAAPMITPDDELLGVITAVTFDPEHRWGSTEAALYGRIGALAGVVVDQAQRLARRDTRSRSDGPIEAALERLRRAPPSVQQHVARILAEVSALATASR
jgi:GAF domain-containing protein